VSNVSFGLPMRDLINASFFTLALGAGLSAAIMNPYSAPMMQSYHTYRALHGLDPSCIGYIGYTETLPKSDTTTAPVTAAPAAKTQNADGITELQNAIVRGLRDRAGVLTAELLTQGAESLTLVQEEIIPALNIVGEGFEKKTVYLPQLLMSAEAAKAAFESIKAAVESQNGNTAAVKCPFVLATVKGDIHDIGKNIVRLLLENYGYEVSDLGRDVTPEAVCDEVIRLHAPLCGLSALMTTTVPAMEETIKLLRERAPFCRVVVGGAVLTQEYADAIGADKYAKDAMETVRYAEEVFAGL
jgi:5-methyltetrahydrofolate--homocysteine methyltransferase